MTSKKNRSGALRSVGEPHLAGTGGNDLHIDDSRRFPPEYLTFSGHLLEKTAGTAGYIEENELSFLFHMLLLFFDKQTLPTSIACDHFTCLMQMFTSPSLLSFKYFQIQ